MTWLWNVDEIGLCLGLDATSKKVLAWMRVKAVYDLGGRSGRSTSLSLIGCGSADGVKLSRLVMCKVKWTKGGL